MRVPTLTFLTNFLIGGTERQVVNLVRNLDRELFGVHLACFRLKGPLLPEVDPQKVALSEYPITTLASPRTLFQQARLARYLRAHHIKIVHSFGFYANVFAIPAARLAGVPVVVASIRDTGDHLTWLQKAMQKAVCRLADHVLVNALAVRAALLKEGYDPARISVIRNGIDVSRFETRERTPGMRAALGLPEQGPVVAVFARLNRLKGIEYFLEAAALLKTRFEEVRFLIVGDSISDAYRRELEAFAVARGLAGRVVFSGFRDDVPALLREVAVSVLPSLSEGLSNVVLEAMASGVPMVATAVGGTPEMVEDGVTGLLVPPRDASALAEAVSSLLADPSRGRTIGAAAKQRVATSFSLQATVRKTERLYEHLMSPVLDPLPALALPEQKRPEEDWR